MFSEVKHESWCFCYRYTSLQYHLEKVTPLQLLLSHGPPFPPSKGLNFAGLVLGVSSMESARYPLVATMVANLFRNTLGADGVIMTKALGGAPTVDLGKAAVECEKLGIKTCMLVRILNTKTDLASEAMFNAPSLNAIVNTGRIFDKIALPVLSNILGGTGKLPKNSGKAGLTR